MKDADHWINLVEYRAWLSRKLKKASSADDYESSADEGENDDEKAAE